MNKILIPDELIFCILNFLQDKELYKAANVSNKWALLAAKNYYNRKDIDLLDINCESINKNHLSIRILFRNSLINDKVINDPRAAILNALIQVRNNLSKIDFTDDHINLPLSNLVGNSQNTLGYFQVNGYLANLISKGFKYCKLQIQLKFLSKKYLNVERKVGPFFPALTDTFVISQANNKINNVTETSRVFLGSV